MEICTHSGLDAKLVACQNCRTDVRKAETAEAKVQREKTTATGQRCFFVIEIF